MKVALIVDALRELRARRLFWVYSIFAVTFVGIAYLVFNGSTSIHMNVNGTTRSAVGAHAVGDMLLGPFAQFLANVALVLVLFGMGGVMSAILDRGTAEVYLSKPVSRASVLVSRVAGHWIGLGAGIAATVAALWLIAGLHGTWTPRLFLALPFILLIALVYLALLALFNVLGAGAGLSGLGAFVVLVATAALRYREMLAAIWPKPAWKASLEWTYRILPKTGEIAAGIPAVVEGHGGPPWFAVWTTTVFVAATLIAAAAVFARRDY